MSKTCLTGGMKLLKMPIPRRQNLSVSRQLGSFASLINLLSLALRGQIEEKLNECVEFQKTIESRLRKKKKTYTDEEYQNKYDRLNRAKDNLELLKDLFNHQSNFEKGKLGIKILSDADIEKEGVFKSNRGRNRADKYKSNNEDYEQDDEAAFRELTDYEEKLLS